MAIIVETWMAEDLEYGVETTTKTHPSGGTLNGHQVNIGSFSHAGPARQCPAKFWTPGVIASGSQATTTIDAPGATVGDKVLVALTSIGTLPMILVAHVSDDNEVTVVLANLTGSSQTIAEGTLSIATFSHMTETPEVPA